jgi:prepilin-type N-terminal cleavage/methylation domain-containing protein
MSYDEPRAKKSRELLKPGVVAAVIPGRSPMARQLLQARADERGITLVEVLVVVLIVAILVGVGLPLFLNQRTKAQDAEAKAMAVTVAGTLVTWEHDNDTFEGADVDGLAAIEPVIGSAEDLTISTTEDSFTVRIESEAGSAGGGPFTIDYDADGTVRSCTTPNHGGCPDGGRW